MTEIEKRCAVNVAFARARRVRWPDRDISCVAARIIKPWGRRAAAVVSLCGRTFVGVTGNRGVDVTTGTRRYWTGVKCGACAKALMEREGIS